MSGYKYSVVDFQKEREELLEIMYGMQASVSRLNGLVHKLEEMLGRTPVGIKELYSDEVNSATRWRGRADEELGEQRRRQSEFDRMKSLTDSLASYGAWWVFGIHGSTDEIRRELEKLNSVVDEGRSLLGTLIASFMQKADILQQGLAARLATLETCYAENAELLSDWTGSESLEGFDSSVRGVAYALADSRVKESELELARLEHSLDSVVAAARTLEQKHQKRLYVLKALRQACRELGLVEVRLAYEDERNKGSNIVYELDTMDEGRLSFILTLDRIKTFSAIYDNKCIDEYAAVSDSMRKEFGVKTKFRREEEIPETKMAYGRELELPRQSVMERAS